MLLSFNGEIDLLLKIIMKIAIFPGKFCKGTAFYSVSHSLYKSLYTNGFSDVCIVNLRGNDRNIDHKIINGFNYMDLWSKRSSTSIPELVWFLFKDRPDILISMPSYVNITSLLSVLIARLFGWKGKIIITEHAVMSQKIIEHKGEFVMSNMPLFARALYQYSDAIVCVSDGVSEDLKNNIKINKTNIYKIYNSVDMHGIIEKSTLSVNIHPWLNNTTNIPCFVSVGRLAVQKNYPFLLRALSIANRSIKVRLLIIGKGCEEDNIRNMINKYNINENVSLIGSHENPYPFIKKSNGLLISSYEEAFGLVIVEALTLGVPVIATDAIGGGPREILNNNKYGFLIDKNDYESYAQKIIDLTINKINFSDSSLLDQSFSVKKIGKEWVKLIDNLTSVST